MQKRSNTSNRVGRGGGWINDAKACRSAICSYCDPSYRGPSLGFRLCAPASSIKPDTKKDDPSKKLSKQDQIESLQDAIDLLKLSIGAKKRRLEYVGKELADQELTVSELEKELRQLEGRK